MAGIGHIGLGFAAKPLAPKVHLAVLLVAPEFIDLLWGVFYITGIDRGSVGASSFPWSHSLFMSVFWSFIAALLVARFYHERRSGIVVGLIVFSHWLVDFITHPMGAIFGSVSLPPDLPLFFNGSLKVGLSLYNHSFAVAIITDLAMFLIGLGIYLYYKIKPFRNRQELLNETHQHQQIK